MPEPEYDTPVADRVLELLSNEKTANQLRKIVEEGLPKAWALWSQAHDLDDRDSLGWDWHDAVYHYMDRMEIGAIFESRVIGHLEQPRPLTTEDLCAQFYRIVIVNRRTVYALEFDEAYELFAADIENYHLVPRTSRPFAICELPKYEEEEPSDVLWSSDGITVRLSGVGLASLDDELKGYGRRYLLYATVEGVMSESAMARLSADVGHAARSIIWSSALLCPEPAVSWGYVDQIGMSMPTTDVIQKQRKFIASCMDGLFPSPSRKDSIDKRIHNAVRLLMEADRQRSKIVGLSLCFAALEALVCGDRANIVGHLSENIATLLERRTEIRQRAIEVIKGLYDVRSRLLHGDSVAEVDKEQKDARLLASCVLKAVLDYQKLTFSISGDQQTPKDLFQELRSTFVQGKTFPGSLKDTPAITLWPERPA